MAHININKGVTNMDKILVEASSIVELAIPKKKLIDKSERVTLNMFKRALQKFLDNLVELHGQKVVDVNCNSSDLHEVYLHNHYYTFINDFDYSASNQCEENKDYKVIRYFGADIILECNADVEIGDFLKSTRIIDIKEGNKVKVITSIVGKRPKREKGYAL